ncbi:MAG: NAD(P)/FAD-dependent oxidoreductase [Oscillospiraceae bacterium]
MIAHENAFDAVVIGGGAAGLFAAAQLGRMGLCCAVAEKNGITGKKLLITGKGRCNVTNNCGADEVLKNVPTNAKFLFSAVTGFPPQQVIAYFEALGVPLKTERGNRVFPVSDQARDIADALTADVKRHGGRIVRGAALEILAENGAVYGVRTETDTLFSRNIIVATGGISYPRTGSTGDGYRFAQALGHTIIAPTASLVPLVLYGKEAAELMGLSLKNVTLSVFRHEKTSENAPLSENAPAGKRKAVFTEQGELLFTHYGVSGPLVLSASAHMKPDKFRYTLEIDLKPALTEQQLDARILRDFAEIPNRDFANSLGRLLPATLIPVIVARSGIAPETKVNAVTRAQRTQLVALLKHISFAVKGFRPADEAVITSGGVNVREIDPKTMASKLTGGLYFAGEVIDVDAYTGGFNLQIAFSTGYAAARSIAQKLELQRKV